MIRLIPYEAGDLRRVAGFLRVASAGLLRPDGSEDAAFAAFLAQGVNRGGRDFRLAMDAEDRLVGVLLSARYRVRDRALPIRAFRIVVAPTARGHGVGQRLLLAVEGQDAAGAVIRRTALHDDEGRRPVAALERRGYRRVQTIRIMHRHGIPPAALPPPTGQRLRDARLPDEAGALAELHNAAHADAFGFVPLEPDDVILVAGARGGRTVVLEGATGLVGAFQTLPYHDGQGVLHAVHVRPEAQGRGAGRLLTLAALHALAQQGFHRVELAVDAANAPAVALYESLGFADDRREYICDKAPS